MKVIVEIPEEKMNRAMFVMTGMVFGDKVGEEKVSKAIHELNILQAQKISGDIISEILTDKQESDIYETLGFLAICQCMKNKYNLSE